MQFELFVAARYLRAKRRQAVIGVITVISIVGVAAGVASLIIALAINNGFRQDLQDRLLGSSSHVNLLRVEADGIRNWQPLLSELVKQPHVVAGAPAIYEQVLISARRARPGRSTERHHSGGRKQSQRPAELSEDWLSRYTLRPGCEPSPNFPRHGRTKRPFVSSHLVDGSYRPG